MQRENCDSIAICEKGLCCGEICLGAAKACDLEGMESLGWLSAGGLSSARRLAVEVGAMFLTAGIGVEGVVPGLRTTDTFEEACQVIPRHPSEDVLIICGPQDRTRVPRVARAVAEHDRIALVTVLGTPTRQAVIASLLLSIPTTYLGVAQAVADAAQNVVETRVALTSVSRLEAGRPSMRQHLRSFFPGASFDVDIKTRKVASVRPVDWSGLPTVLTIEARSALPGQERGLEVLAPQASVYLRLDRKSWNARSWVERSALPDSPGRMAIALAQQVGCGECNRCGRPAGPSGCIFCGTNRSVNKTPSSPQQTLSLTEGAPIR